MILEEINICPLCKGKQFITLHICKDHTNTGEMFPVKQCTNCNFALTSPRPTESNAGKYYQSSAYISHQKSATSLLDHIYHIIRYFALKWKFSLISQHQHTTLLDVGCGTGTFLQYCKQRGITVTGVEPSDARLSISNITIHKTLTDLPVQQFDVITMWHVLEHIYPLHETIKQLKSRLTENGTIFIAVPNRESADAKKYQEHWAAWDVPRHIWHFSSDNMKALLKDAGLQIVEVIPMKLDAYYVSLLSEKYQHSNKLTIMELLTAIRTAIQSNWAAKKTNQYSSLIYRITK